MSDSETQLYAIGFSVNNMGIGYAGVSMDGKSLLFSGEEKYEDIDLKSLFSPKNMDKKRKALNRLSENPEICVINIEMMNVVSRYVKSMGSKPELIYVEGEADLQKPLSAGQLKEKYKKVGLSRVSNPAWESLQKLDDDASFAITDHHYYYFRQLGKDIYTEKDMMSESGSFPSNFPKDHIIPQCLFIAHSMDIDSCEQNRALTCEAVNDHDDQKSDKVNFVDDQLLAERIDFWKMLLNVGLIDKFVFDKLTYRYSQDSDQKSKEKNDKAAIALSQTPRILRVIRDNYPLGAAARGLSASEEQEFCKDHGLDYGQFDIYQDTGYEQRAIRTVLTGLQRDGKITNEQAQGLLKD